jgi:hypothetical protein
MRTYFTVALVEVPNNSQDDTVPVPTIVAHRLEPRDPTYRCLFETHEEAVRLQKEMIKLHITCKYEVCVVLIGSE